MAKLKSSFTAQTNGKAPVLGVEGVPTSGSSKIGVTRDLASKLLSVTNTPAVPKGLQFGVMHTRTPAAAQSGSSWTGLLNLASGGVSSVLGGGLLTPGGVGFIGKLLSLFGGGKPVPAAPVQFQSPVPRQNSLNIAPNGAASSVALGVHSINTGSSSAGVYQHLGSVAQDQHFQSVQVVQIVKQALLTSSSLNDVISEI